MGIQGLLPVLRSLTVPTHLRELRGQTCAVDVYSWIHRGTYACATELCMEGSSDGYVSFCLAMLDMLLAHSITPIMVFDGARLVAKEDVERDREAKRATGLEEGKRLMAIGKSKEALNAFVRAVDVTPEMARKVVLAFRSRQVQVIVAPFEADAQLAYLSHQNKADFIISEDSDLLAFGSKRVLFKLDRTGNGQMIDARRLRLAEEVYLEHFTPEMFLDMCILAGCDYVDSIQGVGMKTAHQLVQKYKVTERILRGLRFECKGQVIPPDYERRFYRAKLTFKHQSVFCPDLKCFVKLTPLPDAPGDVAPYSMFSELSFLGLPRASDRAEEWARGDINVETLEPFPPPQQEDATMIRRSTSNPSVKPSAANFLMTRQGGSSNSSSHPMAKSLTLDSFFTKKPQQQQQRPVLPAQPSSLGRVPRPSSGMLPLTSNPWIGAKSSCSTPSTTSRPPSSSSIPNLPAAKSRFFPSSSVQSFESPPPVPVASLISRPGVFSHFNSQEETKRTTMTVLGVAVESTTTTVSRDIIEGDEENSQDSTGNLNHSSLVVQSKRSVEETTKEVSLLTSVTSSETTIIIKQEKSGGDLVQTSTVRFEDVEVVAMTPITSSGMISQETTRMYDTEGVRIATVSSDNADVHYQENEKTIKESPSSSSWSQETDINTGSTQATNSSQQHAAKKPRLMIGLSARAASSVSSTRPTGASAFSKYAYRA